ncbi:hypothetical protein F5B18DRAFT_645784 [Nemania serpens]|nr:hypothetical protein F5B18DRAFT_645784 [Nemania serpens]
MLPAMRGSRWSSGAGTREDEANRDVSAGIGGSAQADEQTGEINALMSTPQASTSSNVFFGSADLSRPITRSARKGHFDSILVESPPLQSRAQNRLRDATIENGAPVTTTSNLEEARDIHYGPTEGDDEEDEGDEGDVQIVARPSAFAERQNSRSKNGHSTIGGLCVPRRSDRIRAKALATREASPSTALTVATVNSNRIRKKRKKGAAKTSSVSKPSRRSPRLAKPLDVFHKYPELPPEIRLLIWEAAIQPRLAYICNRSSILGHAHIFGIQNKLPSWFMTCQLSVYIAKQHYQTLFEQNGLSMYPAMGIPLRPQAINPFVDVVIFEPCHNGCRGYYCAQQYRREDRAAVHRLVVQMDSPHLPTMSDPGWVTISRSWPNVQTLFMMKPALKGLDRSDKAMIRIKEGDHELALRKRFELWKKGDGQDNKLTTLEFVRVVEQEPETKNIQDRYQSVEDRRTGLAEDIILG